MRPTDEPELRLLIADVMAFYRQDVSDFSLGVWTAAMRPFDLHAVRVALERHCMNPDTGQFAPKPADIVRALGGTTQDSALVAWAKVDKAVRTVGPWKTVVFDDPIIHRVLGDMGGWAQLGNKSEQEWPFVAKEFETRYRGYRTRGGVDSYPPRLEGLAESQNGQKGLPAESAMLVGDARKALAVELNGTAGPAVAVTHVSELPKPEVRRIGESQEGAR